MAILILIAIALLLIPLARRWPILRRMLLFVGAVLTSALCLHFLLVAGILVRSLLQQ